MMVSSSPISRILPTSARQGKLGAPPNLLGAQLNAAKKLVYDSFVETLAKKKLSPGLFGMLIVIGTNSGINQTELSALLNINRSQTVRYLDKLESLRLAKRTRDKNDRRNQIVSIEEKGQKILEQLLEEIQTHEKKTASHLTIKEQQKLSELLQKLTGLS